MKTIHIDYQQGATFFTYPDQQPHVRLSSDIQENDDVKVVCSLTHPAKILQLLEVSNAIDHIFAKKKVLVIPYLMAARFDRIMQPGDSFDLEVVAEMINHCAFDKVILWDVHSEVAMGLIKKAVNVPNKPMVQSYCTEDSVLICPDAGSAKKVKEYLTWNPCLVDVVYCIKNRNVQTGELNLRVLEPEKCVDRSCVIIDDLCDGGSTFLEIAKQIQPKRLTLVVTHGIFSKGFDELSKYFHEIIVSNSYASHYNSPLVKLIAVSL